MTMGMLRGPFKFRRITINHMGGVVDNAVLSFADAPLTELDALRLINQWNAAGNVAGRPLRFVYILEG